MKNLFLGICTAFVLASCGTMSSSSASKVGKTQPSLAGTKWALADNVKGKVPTLNIDGEKINGNAGCNNYFGTAKVDASTGNFSAGQMGSTKMMCDNMNVENNFMDMMGKANKYVVSGNTLELYKDNLLLLKFNKAE
ncbi:MULTISPECIES: META domain-containing protein [Chryseobacterium]|jgi:heat shock protein HslJ|uniref:Heat shock protein HslJ n=1 Tax=Chryseobacterium geocarposphaerae TaxID=1416776 RepID=A0ABU1LBN1_9FLAO|nr:MULTISPECIES: META domain-containing protein [Chryseobacterium]MDR6404131.1 heat shock protein HslJ [Chryseobacterium geocarposphaerae]MDR6698350.1 heat shock protein HslJ [Chryseobacterium ginsenosidimutans]